MQTRNEIDVINSYNNVGPCVITSQLISIWFGLELFQYMLLNPKGTQV